MEGIAATGRLPDSESPEVGRHTTEARRYSHREEHTMADSLLSFDGGRVLDVATGQGNFVQALVAELKGFSEIVAIDAEPTMAAAFEKGFKDEKRVRFMAMDGSALAFADGSFDTVCVSNSLHHFAEPRAVLAEMLRVLKKGGRFVLTEMHRDVVPGPQESHVLLHHWWAQADRATGTFHAETYARQELLAFVQTLGLESLAIEDINDDASDPHDPETLSYIEASIEKTFTKAAASPSLPAIRARGEELRALVKEKGFRSAASILAVGVKA